MDDDLCKTLDVCRAKRKRWCGRYHLTNRQFTRRRITVERECERVEANNIIDGNDLEFLTFSLNAHRHHEQRPAQSILVAPTDNVGISVEEFLLVRVQCHCRAHVVKHLEERRSSPKSNGLATMEQSLSLERSAKPRELLRFRSRFAP